MKIHLGVIDIPYVDEASTTTGDVAEKLEEKYHVMEAYANYYAEDIAADLGNAAAIAIEGIIEKKEELATGAWKAFSQNTATRFKKFLTTGKAGQIGIGGTPTVASLTKRSSRMKRSGKPRGPSFVDTGLYRRTMTVWID